MRPTRRESEQVKLRKAAVDLWFALQRMGRHEGPPPTLPEPPSDDGDDSSGSGVPRRPAPSAGSASAAAAEPSADDPVVGYRVDDLVKGWVQRSYLKRDGWWAQLVLDEFDFLRGLGFSLSGSEMAGVQFHQKGHFVDFHRSDRDVVIEYDPETDTIGAVVIDHSPHRWIPLDDLILRHVPGAQPPTRAPLVRAMVEANVRWWAAGLRHVASEVLLSTRP
jgi:hypothetical protein